MGFIVFLMFLSLVACLFLSLVRKGKAGRRSQLVRAVVVILCTSVFAYWFFQKSVTRFIPDSLAVQLINKLPQPLDFYIIKKDKTENGSFSFNTNHVGKIRPDHYRLEYLLMPNSDEFWVAGYLGKKNMVYFSQHYIPNKNMDQIIEVQNYIIQSQKLAGQAQTQIKEFTGGNVSLSVWVTLTLLLLFMNFVLLFKRAGSYV